MTISVMAAGMLRPIKAESVMVGGVLRKLKSVKVMRGDALVTVAIYNTTSPLSAEAVPSIASGSAFGTGPRFVITNAVTATASGGVAPYSYSCEIVSGSPMTITSPTSATTRFQKTTAASVSAIARWTITDSLGATTTCDCTVELERETGA